GPPTDLCVGRGGGRLRFRPGLGEDNDGSLRAFLQQVARAPPEYGRAVAPPGPTGNPSPAPDSERGYGHRGDLLRAWLPDLLSADLLLPAVVSRRPGEPALSQRSPASGVGTIPLGHRPGIARTLGTGLSEPRQRSCNRGYHGIPRCRQQDRE